MRRPLSLLLVALAAAAPGPASDPRAAQADAEAARLGDQLVQAASRLREAEQRTVDVAVRVDALAQRGRAAEEALADRARDLSPMLPLIERLSLQPAETMLAVPASPDDAVRGLLVLRGLASELERQATDLRREQAEIAAAQARIEDEAPRLRAARDAQAAEAAALDRRVADARRDRDAARSAASEAAERAQGEAARAKTLRGAVLRLAAARQPAPATGGGSMAQPVAGAVVQSWGEATDAGPAAGVSYRAAPAARVVSPCDGRAVFAAPFRSYGRLLIVDCGGDVRVVLGGLDRLDVRAGDALRRGEPVGAMADWDPTRAAARPSLYLELRRAGEAVDPAPFLAGAG